jgi:hypothetical protein
MDPTTASVASAFPKIIVSPVLPQWMDSIAPPSLNLIASSTDVTLLVAPLSLITASCSSAAFPIFTPVANAKLVGFSRKVGGLASPPQNP